MNKKLSNTWKKILSFLFWFFLPLLPLLVPNIDKNPVLLSILTTGYVAWVLKLSVDHFDLANFWFNKAALFLFNKEVSWTMTVNFEGDFEATILKDIYKAIKDKFPDSIIWRNDEYGLVIKLPAPLGGTLRLEVTNGIQIQDIESGEALLFELSDFVVPFRNSRQSLIRLIDLIDEAVRPIANPTDEKYTFKVKFGETNPYFGLFVRRLRIPEKSKIFFNVSYEEKEGTNSGKVQISSDKVVLITHNLSSLHGLSSKYITLASLDLSEA